MSKLKVGVLVLIGIVIQHSNAERHESSYDNSYKAWSGCLVPHEDRVVPFNWNQAGVTSGGYYFAMSSTSDNHIETDMVGSHDAKCVRMKWSDDDITVNLFSAPASYTGAYFRCFQIDPPLNMWECEHLRAEGATPDLSHRTWITLTDDETFSFTVRCFPHIRKQGWVVFSTEKKLSVGLQNRILHHAKSLGYSTWPGRDVFFRNYDHCPKLCLV